jgi:ribulose-phosphate 3-epimerase
MMCANYGHLADEVRALDDAGADIFHCDIMDGNFVPNFTMGVMDVKTIRRYTDKKVDCHLMIENPGSKTDWFIDAGADIIYIHPESERYVVKTLAHIKERGVCAGIAVNPGFAGQGFIDFTTKKIKQLVELKKEYGYKLMIDGHCTPQVVSDMSALGVDGFILGTSGLFQKGKSYTEMMRALRGEEGR